MNKPIIPITNLETFKVRISQIPPFDVAFNTMVLTDYEMLVATIYRLNELIEINQEYIDLTEETLNWIMEDGLTLEVTNKLLEWLNDGTLENLINDTLFDSKLDKTEFNTFKSQLNTQLLDIVDNLEDDINQKYTFLDEKIDIEVESLETDISNVETTVNQNEIKTNQYLDDISINIKKYEHLVTDDDWSLALQTALNECDDEGDIILIPFKIEVKNTIKFPSSSKSNSKLKAITITGIKHSKDDSPVNSDTNGKSVIYFTGDGALFDMTGTVANVNSTVSLKNLALIGDKKVDTVGVVAEQLKKAIFDNLTVRDFDKGLVVNSYSFYSVFRNLTFLNNRLVGAEFNQRVNGSSIENCKFHTTYEGIGLKLIYAGNGNNIISSYFEGNGVAGIRVERTDQLSLMSCYFENNLTHVDLVTVSAGLMVTNIIGCGFSYDVNMDHLIKVTNNVILNLIGNRFKLNKSISKIITRGGTGLKLVVMNNMFEGDYPLVDYIEPSYLTILENNNIKTNNIDVVNRIRVNTARVSSSGVSGSATKKYELLDLDGNRLGFIPIHDS